MTIHIYTGGSKENLKIKRFFFLAHSLVQAYVWSTADGDYNGNSLSLG